MIRRSVLSAGNMATASKMGEGITTSTGRVWLGPDGIVYCANRSKAQQTLEHARENVDAIRQTCGGRKRPILIDMSVPAPQTSDCRKFYTSPEAAETALAVAVLSPSSLGKVIGNFLIGMNAAKIPLRLFTSEGEALDWLGSFL